AKQKAEQERLKQEALAKQKAEQERLKQEALAKQKAEQERLRREELAKQKAEEERLKQEALAKQKAEQERLRQEELAKQKAEEERLRQEALAKQKAEEERRKQVARENLRTAISNLNLQGIQFDINSATIKIESLPILKDIETTLRNFPAIEVTIEGHTDGSGDEVLNLALSIARANSVRNHLIERGISGLRMAAKGFGESQPIQTNATPAGRSANRRIEIKVIN
ncbi:MAG: OmpA family protein, partial [Acidiferrobacterales bacterium]|nr:OmpA family protein [Acidiferrobacterales bacterium]